MQKQLLFRQKKFSKCTFDIFPTADFQEVIDTLDELSFPNLAKSKDHIVYAILELISNSIRAHKERSIAKSLNLQFIYDTEGLIVTLKDHGGGFDTSKLPYDFFKPIEEVDINSDSFQSYREENGYQRFGMGLVIARKTFHSLRLSFYNEDEEFSAWRPTETVGSKFVLSVRYDYGA